MNATTRTRNVLLASAVLAVGISPFAIARTGDNLREGVRNGTTTSETEVISEDFRMRNDRPQYWRVARFSDLDEPLLAGAGSR